MSSLNLFNEVKEESVLRNSIPFDPYNRLQTKSEKNILVHPYFLVLNTEEVLTIENEGYF